MTNQSTDRPISPWLIGVIKQVLPPWSTDKNGKVVLPEWKQRSVVSVADEVMDWHQAAIRAERERVLEEVETVFSKVMKHANSESTAFNLGLLGCLAELEKTINRLRKEGGKQSTNTV